MLEVKIFLPTYKSQQQYVKFFKKIQKYIKFVKDRPFNDKRYCVSTNKIRKLGWSPKNSLMKDLAYIIEWYIRNKRLFKNFN